MDANLYHDLISGRSVTGILHLANQTLIDSFSKLQSTVETATFGSEYVAARTCTEQIIDLRNTFRYLGVPVEHATMMFGDNESIMNTASVPHSRLHKRHNALSYHKTRQAIAAGITRFTHIDGKRMWLVSTGTIPVFAAPFVPFSSGEATLVRFASISPVSTPSHRHLMLIRARWCK